MLVPPHWAGHDPPSVCLSVLSFPRWVSHLITAKTKYTLAHQSVPDREEGNRPFLGWEMGSVLPQEMGTLWGAVGPSGAAMLGATAPVWDHWELCS